MNAAGIKSHRKQKAESLAEVCSVRVEETMFGVPISHILEIVGSTRPQPVPLAPEYVGGLVHYRGDVLTTVSLRHLLGLPPKDGKQDILVLECAGEQRSAAFVQDGGIRLVVRSGDGEHFAH